MKKDIHPEYVDTQVTCTCGNTFTTRSTATSGTIHADVCSQCHPFYTGKQKILDTGGRVARFEARYAKSAEGARRSSSTAAPVPASMAGAGARACVRDQRPAAGRSACSRPSTALVDEHAELEQRLADPAIHADQRLAKRLNQRYAELSADRARPTRDWHAARRRHRGRPRARRRGRRRSPRGRRRWPSGATPPRSGCATCWCPRDPTDDKDALLEVKSGEGGEESALFAGDLLRMYTRYAERRGWKTEMLDATESDLGGYKSVTVAVKAKGTPEPGEAPYALLKFEGGVHRVQRVPVTESPGPRAHLRRRRAGDARGRAGRRHDRRERPAHRRLPLQRAPAARASTPPTPRSGSPTCRPASWSAARTRRASCRTASRRCASCAPGCSPPPRRRPTPRPATPAAAQVRTVDRSERIRTYNYPENRISDHRTGYKAYNLDQVLDGDLEPVIDSCVEADLAARLDGARAVTPCGRGRCVADGRRPARATAGVASPEHDAAELLAHVLGTDPRPAARCVDDVAPTTQARRTTPWSARRAAREPLQHLTGTAAFRHVELAVGPGVFVPAARDRAAGRLGDRAGRRRSDRGAGRGRPRAPAPARSRWRVADEVPARRVHAVELDEPAHALGRRATSPAPASTCGSATWPTPFDDLAGTVDVVVCNPPYIPLEAWESVAPEARDHDPHLALCSGDDGLDAMRVLERRRRPAAPARGSGRRRARRRPGRVRAGGLRGDRPLGRRPRPPRPGRSSALRDRPAGTMTPVTEADERWTSAASARDRRRDRAGGRRSRPPASPSSAGSWWCCPPTPSTASAPTPSTPRPCSGCSTPRAAAARCRRRCWSARADHARRAGDRRPGVRPRAGRASSGPAR